MDYLTTILIYHFTAHRTLFLNKRTMLYEPTYIIYLFANNRTRTKVHYLRNGAFTTLAFSLRPRTSIKISESRAE